MKLIVTKEFYDKIFKFRFSNQIDLAEDKTWCPEEGCGGVARIIGGNLFGECQKCYFRFCLTCEHWYHSGRRCPVLSLGKSQFAKMSKREQEEFLKEKLNDFYVKKHCKNCPQCHTPISKTDGCNKMICRECGVYFCWKCLAIIKGYDHFNVSPECWDTSGDRDIGQLSVRDLDEVKNNIDDQDMENAIVCPDCGKIVNKKSEDNFLQCDHCSCTLCFYCGKHADKDHYHQYSCFRTTKLIKHTSVNAVAKDLGWD